jgi:hypothetical protein
MCFPLFSCFLSIATCQVWLRCACVICYSAVNASAFNYLLRGGLVLCNTKSPPSNTCGRFFICFYLPWLIMYTIRSSVRSHVRFGEWVGQNGIWYLYSGLCFRSSVVTKFESSDFFLVRIEHVFWLYRTRVEASSCLHPLAYSTCPKYEVPPLGNVSTRRGLFCGSEACYVL